MKDKVVIFWFRRDLRLNDNTGLHFAMQSDFPVLPIFIFDTTILDQLEVKKDRRVDYIHQVLERMNSKIASHGSCLRTYIGKPLDIFDLLSKEFDIQEVYCNRDYEPTAIERDRKVFEFLAGFDVKLRGFKDQVIFDKHDIVKSDGLPYTVFTPYSKKWKEKLVENSYTPYSTILGNLYQQTYSDIPSLTTIGFEKSDIIFEEPFLDDELIATYDQYRDYPALQKTTQLGIALRFGTISVRSCVSFALSRNQIWLSELIWREFFMQILYHFPEVVNRSFKIKYDSIRWRNNEDEFEKWCTGHTGYPIVDAGMRQLNSTGFMHNRVRMIVASFLCKHLLIDWRWGEAYFAQKLDDYDLSANNGNWQWAAGCGCDAAPYFRVFSPALQTEKFDKNMDYINRWLPEFNTEYYVKPIVEHSFARDRALRVYAEAVK